MSNKVSGMLLLFLFLCSGCFSNDEINHYIVLKNGPNLERYAKVTYRIDAHTGQIVYWTETPGLKPSQRYSLKKCKVTDLNNWEGDAENIVLWKVRVKLSNGKFNSIGAGFENVDWFTWNFGTESNVSSLLKFPEARFAILGMLFGIPAILGLIFWARGGLRRTGRGHGQHTLVGRQILGRAKKMNALAKSIPGKYLPAVEDSIDPDPIFSSRNDEESCIQKKNGSRSQEFPGQGVRPRIRERLLLLQENVTTREDVLVSEKSANRQEQLKSDPQIDLQAMLRNLDEK